MAYMTGILPIAKYSSGSELNMFFEYSMATRAKFSEYFDAEKGIVNEEKLEGFKEKVQKVKLKFS
jgi:hypothetical protein